MTRRNSSFLTASLSISCTKPFINNDLNAHVVRVRFCPVVIMDALRPRRVRHIGPLVLVESRGVLEALLLHIQYETLVHRVKRQCSPGYREKFLAHTEETAKGQDCIAHSATAHIEHDFLDVTKIFIFLVVHVIANERVSTHQFWTWSLAHAGPRRTDGVDFVHAVRVAFFVVHMNLRLIALVDPYPERHVDWQTPYSGVAPRAS